MSRRPRGTHWTQKELQAIRSDWKGETLADGGGLFGEVRIGPDGGIFIPFRYSFRFDGKKQWFYAGSWPSVDMSEIRARRNKAREDVQQGINPKDRKLIEASEREQALVQAVEDGKQAKDDRLTVDDLFKVWVANGVARKDDNKELKRSFQKDVLPEIGHVELRLLTDHAITLVLRKILSRDVIRIAILVLDDITQMLSWAEKRQPWRRLLENGNPALLVDIDKLIPLDYEEERDRILSSDEIQELARIFRRMDEEYEQAADKRNVTRPLNMKSRIALWLCLSTLCRIGELLMARWEHVDLEEGVWFIPKINVKGRRNKKQEQYVYLSDFAKRQFEALQLITGDEPWCFPSRSQDGEQTHVSVKTVTKQVADRQVQFKNRTKAPKGRAYDNSLVLAGGATGDWTPHDLRRTGASMMQALGITLDVIDRCQNHLMPGRVRRVYLRYDYEKEKTRAWQLLSEQLGSILS